MSDLKDGRNPSGLPFHGQPISKDCKHCEHLTARWEDTAGEHKRWQCCHCGRIRSEFDTVWETGEHGPALSDE